MAACRWSGAAASWMRIEWHQGSVVRQLPATANFSNGSAASVRAEAKQSDEASDWLAEGLRPLHLVLLTFACPAVARLNDCLLLVSVSSACPP